MTFADAAKEFGLDVKSLIQYEQKNIMFEETKNRSIRKSIGWRVLAVVNSYIILAFYLTESPFWNAIFMNITGAGLYNFYERFWN